MKSQYSHRFSVFTATYNRGSHLRRLFKDLCNQSFKDFEWVVVSDGSTDDTDVVMAELIAQNIIDIKYIPVRQNEGKHKAWRVGLKNFSGRYIITADDDDPFLPNALEVHNKYWEELEDSSDYNYFWEVKSRCQDNNGHLVGTPLALPYFDSDYIEVNIKMGNRAEMVGSRKLEILKTDASVPPFLFEDKCSNFPENLRWINAARKYKTRFVPDITRIYTPNETGLVSANRTERSMYNTLGGGGCICC
ncbi:MAG: glycosyltransferase [Muribaculum sp.]|nr:glycosyltransferase [Muribaculum sp.]